MMDYSKLTIFEIRDGIVNKKFSCKSVVEFFIEKCKEKKELNAIIEVFSDAVKLAEKIDKKVESGTKMGKLAGVPVVIKDNIFYKGHKVTCASKLLQDYEAPYSATVVDKILSEDAIIIARSNMDEFAMGGSTEKSYYGVCHNAVNPDYVAGGSSGGSAVAVASGVTPLALGTDTGGSIRQPSSYNGVVGVKPTYGTVSRYGIVAFASSLDQCSPITKTVDECEFVLKIISGADEKDATSIDNQFIDSIKEKYTIGICREVVEKFSKMSGYKYFSDVLKKLSKKFNVVEVSIPHITNSLACYYVIAPAEATSNLARFDAVKYGKRSNDAHTLEEVYTKSRSEGFGKEVKRRIMLGNFVLSSGYFDAYYNKAKKIQRLIRSEFKDVFLKVDALMIPTTTGTAFKIGEKMKDPVSMYLEDLFTVPANIAGIPAMSVPYARAENGLPLGMQILADEKNEATMFNIARLFNQCLEGK